MKRYPLLLVLAFAWMHSNAQQPFEKYGYKVKVATLSKGKYVEAFDQDTVVQIGSIIMNRRTGKIISFVTYDTVRRESDLQPELISRWWSPDPLADEFYNESPYNFVHNNPIKFIDPDGRAASPYYDQDGHFLGNDENGFKGQVYVTNKETFDKNSQNGVADSKSIQSDQNTVGLQDAGLNSEGLSNVYTNILQQTGYDVSKLDGGAVAVSGQDDSYNNPSVKKDGYAVTSPNPDGTFKISVDQQNKSTKLLSSVENIQSAIGEHEFKGHGLNHFGIPSEIDHYKAYELQIKHPTWDNTTPDFKNVTNSGYMRVLQPYPQLFRQKFPMYRNK